MNHPPYFFIEVQQDSSSKIKPILKQTNVCINGINYDLAGVIYYASDHFWTQHLFNTMEQKPGYYLYNDLKYKGKQNS